MVTGRLSTRILHRGRVAADTDASISLVAGDISGHQAFLRTLKKDHIRWDVGRRRWNYFGHIYRYPKERHAKYLLTATPQFLENAAPPRGRPKENWFGQIQKMLEGIVFEVVINNDVVVECQYF